MSALKSLLALVLMSASLSAFGAANLRQGEMKKTVIPRAPTKHERITYGEFNFNAAKNAAARAEEKKATRAPAAKAAPVKMERSSYGDFSMNKKTEETPKTTVTKKTVSKKTETTTTTKQR